MQKSPSKLLLFNLLLLMLVGCKTDYTRIMRSAMERVYGGPKDFTRGHWFSFPTDNFGVGTTYLSQGKTVNLDDTHNELCATWSCLNKDGSIPKDEITRLTVMGYADSGSGADIRLDETNKMNLAATAWLPAIAKLINLNANAGYTNEIATSFEFGRAHRRKLNLNRWIYYWRTNNSPDMAVTRTAYFQDKAGTATEDLVVDSVTATIRPKGNATASLKAALTNAAIKGVVGEGATLAGAVTQNKDGSFTFKTVSPVVVWAHYGKIPAFLFSGVQQAFTPETVEKLIVPLEIKSKK